MTNPREISKCIRATKNKKAPGTDSILNSILKKLPNCRLSTLANICNAYFKYDYFPRNSVEIERGPFDFRIQNGPWVPL